MTAEKITDLTSITEISPNNLVIVGNSSGQLFLASAATFLSFCTSEIRQYDTNFIDYANPIQLASSTVYKIPFDGLIIAFSNACESVSLLLNSKAYYCTETKDDKTTPVLYRAGLISYTRNDDNNTFTGISKYFIPAGTSIVTGNGTLVLYSLIDAKIESDNVDEIANMKYADMLADFNSGTSGKLAKYFSKFEFLGRVTGSTSYTTITDMTAKYYDIKLVFNLIDKTNFVMIRQPTIYTGERQTTAYGKTNAISTLLRYYTSTRYFRVWSCSSNSTYQSSQKSLSEIGESLKLQCFNFSN